MLICEEQIGLSAEMEKVEVTKPSFFHVRQF